MPFTDVIFGKMLATDEEGEHRVGVLTGIPMLGLDALASAAYGPEAALTLLLPLGIAGPRYVGPISTLIIALLLVVYFSYRQTIEAYPLGGGSYTVAKENLGTTAGLLAAAALMLDYVLVVAVGISAGVGALISAVPQLQPFTLVLCLAILLLITVVNLRGVRESGLAFVVPTYVFVFSLLAVLAVGTIKALVGGGQPEPVYAPAALDSTATTDSGSLTQVQSQLEPLNLSVTACLATISASIRWFASPSRISPRGGRASCWLPPVCHTGRASAVQGR